MTRTYVVFTAACVAYIFGLLAYDIQREQRKELEQALRATGPVLAFPSPPDVRVPIPAARPGSRRAVQLGKVVDADPLISQIILSTNPSLGRRAARELANSIQAAAEKNGVDPYLLTALVRQESAFHSGAVSSVGAVGYGQLMPATAEELGVNALRPSENLDGAARYLSWQLARWGTNGKGVQLALASYNAGAGVVAHYGGVPPYPETQHYVRVISQDYHSMRSVANASILEEQSS